MTCFNESVFWMNMDECLVTADAMRAFYINRICLYRISFDIILNIFVQYGVSNWFV